MKKSIFLIAITAVFILSCSKKDRDNDGKSLTVSTIEHIDLTSGNTYSIAFDYDAADRISTLTQSYTTNGVPGSRIFKYAYSGNTITRTSDGLPASIAVTDGDGRITSISTVIGGDTIKSTFLYNLRGQMLAQAGGSEVKIEWNDDNMTSNVLVIGGSPINKSDYEYGSQINTGIIDIVMLVEANLTATNGWLGFNFGRISHNTPIKISDGITSRMYDYTTNENGRIETIVEYDGGEKTAAYTLTYK